MATTYRVSGMSCEGCVRAITNAIRAQVPDAAVEADIAAGTVRVDARVGDDAIRDAVEEAGFAYGGVEGG